MRRIVKKIFPWAIRSVDKDLDAAAPPEEEKEISKVEEIKAAPVAENIEPVEDVKAETGEPAKDEKGEGPPVVKKKGRSRSSRRKKKPVQPAKESQPVKDLESAKEQEDEKPPAHVKLLINADEPEECRIALIEDGKLESFHVTTVVREQTKGNIYKGRVAAIEPNLQAVFIDIGLEKNGFLPFAEIHPEYFHSADATSQNWRKLNVQEIIKKGQEMLVQVVKEATGNKGANMTTYLSIPGRSLVLMPGSDSAGVSRKIDDEAQRTELREIMDSCNIPEGIGYIVRTASKDTTKAVLSKDLRYLLRLWTDIKKRGQQKPSPALIYHDQEIITKFLRDHFSVDIEEILVDNQESYDQVASFMALVPPLQRKARIRLHKGDRPIFNHYDVEEQIEQIYQPMVKLPSGGSIVISPTEALVAIDVNSGSTSKDKDFAETIFLANKEAAVELSRQLRLRDLGGLVVVDFIDMRNPRHNREVEKLVKTSMKKDRAKVDISRISRFGLMEISRQKMGSPIHMDSYKVCEHCNGRGLIRSVETQALFYLRRIQTAVIKKGVKKVTCRFPTTVAEYLLKNKCEDLAELENKHKTPILVEAAPGMGPTEHEIKSIRD